MMVDARMCRSEQWCVVGWVAVVMLMLRACGLAVSVYAVRVGRATVANCCLLSRLCDVVCC